MSSQPRPPAPPAVLMGLDYGKARIGIALTNPEQDFVFAHKVFERPKKLLATLETINRIAEEYAVRAIILGYPLNADGSEGKMCQAVRAFAANLKKQGNLPIFLQDERYSSLGAANDAEAAADLLRRSIEKFTD